MNSSARERLAAVVKSYDIRGPSPERIDPALAFALGAAFAEEVGISDGRGRAVVGRDMRPTSPALAAAAVEGILAAGAEVSDVGLATTDMVYFASGEWELPGLMITASHNPAGDNGIKLCRAGARPIGLHTGLSAIADRAATVLEDGDSPVSTRGLTSRSTRGSVRECDALTPYAERVTALVPVGTPPDGRALRVVVDAGNAMAGHAVPAVFERFDVDLVPLYFELDGRFPHHAPDPLDPANLADLKHAVMRYRADIGLAFDGDADRCLVVDESGDDVAPSVITALIAERCLRRHPGAIILHNVVCSRAVPEVVRECGGRPVRTPVGHSLIKAEMARTGAIFGGEHSGHYYFAEFFGADSGMLAGLHVMAALAESDRPLTRLAAAYQRYATSGEINRTVSDTTVATESVRRQLASDSLGVDTLDGLTVDGDGWWFNLRASQTEPLLRLNVEADDAETMTRVRDRVLTLIEQEENL